MPYILFDPLSEAFARDPYPAYAKLREQAAPVWHEGMRTWLLSRYEHVQGAAVDKRFVRSGEGVFSPADLKAEQVRDNWHDMPHHERFVQFSLLNSDGQSHQRLRRLIFGEFTNGMVMRLKGEIESFVAGLFDGLVDRQEIDFIEDVANHVPGHIIGRLLGVPDEDCPQLRTWSENIVQYFDIDRTDERKALAETTTKTFYDYLIDLSAQRRKAPKDDVISRLIAVYDRAEMSEDEYISTCMLILMAGHGSTIDALGSGLYALLKYPDQMQILRENRSVLTSGIQEMFRYDAPLPYFTRYASEDLELFGVDMPKGTKIGLLYSAANRDAEAFPDADRFDVARTPNRHLAFGGGAHFCLGNHLSRLNMEVIFTTLFERYSAIDLIEAPIYRRSLSARGPLALNIALKRL
jgi:cytochrome P450